MFSVRVGFGALSGVLRSSRPAIWSRTLCVASPSQQDAAASEIAESTTTGASGAPAQQSSSSFASRKTGGSRPARPYTPGQHSGSAAQGIAGPVPVPSVSLSVAISQSQKIVGQEWFQRVTETTKKMFGTGDEHIKRVVEDNEFLVPDVNRIDISSALRKYEVEAEAADREAGAPKYVREVDAEGRAYGTGRRKNASARVWLSPGTGQVSVNGKSLVEYFPRLSSREHALDPLFTAQLPVTGYDVRCLVSGGGTSGQAGAVRLGLARALQAMDPDLRPALKQEGLLTRDPRAVERKKYGQKKARKQFQWVKR